MPILQHSVLEAIEGHLIAGLKDMSSRRQNSGHIGTRQIQRLLDTVTEKAGLQR